MSQPKVLGKEIITPKNKTLKSNKTETEEKIKQTNFLYPLNTQCQYYIQPVNIMQPYFMHPHH